MNSIIDYSLPAAPFPPSTRILIRIVLFCSSLRESSNSITMDITSPKNNAMEELDESAGEALVVAVPTIASSPVTAEPANMVDVAVAIHPPVNDDFDTEDVSTEDVSTPTTAPVDVATGCECQQCLYARDINSGLCCCYYCLNERRDQQSRQRRDTAVATTPEIPPPSMAVATNRYHQREAAWEVYNNTGDWDDYDEYLHCCFLSEEGNDYNEDDEEEEEEE
jgi:hypothetical protein